MSPEFHRVRKLTFLQRREPRFLLQSVKIHYVYQEYVIIDLLSSTNLGVFSCIEVSEVAQDLNIDSVG